MNHEQTPLTADEYLQFSYITDRLTHADIRRKLSGALSQVERPLTFTVVEAWHRAARTMWRTAPGDIPTKPWR